MRAITVPTPGDFTSLVMAEVPGPSAGPGEVLIEVAASGVNRADVLQRMGFYPPPPGASRLLGLEVSGRIVACGSQVNDWQVGDKVCALLTGGGYAPLVAVPATQLLPIPEGVALEDAGGLPEVACTVWNNLIMVAGLTADETLLVHGGSSGIGTMAIQVAKARGARVAVTAGSATKVAACRALGADIAINYHEQDFVEVLREATEGNGADVILDTIGAKYLPRNVSVLASDGRMVVIGLLGGRTGELDLAALLVRQASIFATSLRSRSSAQKTQIVAAVRRELWPLIESGQIRPVIGSRYPLTQAAQAHQELEASTHIGKILLLADR